MHACFGIKAIIRGREWNRTSPYVGCNLYLSRIFPKLLGLPDTPQTPKSRQHARDSNTAHPPAGAQPFHVRGSSRAPARKIRIEASR